MVRPDPLLYLGSWRVGGPDGSAQNQGGRQSSLAEMLGYDLSVGVFLKCLSLTAGDTKSGTPCEA